MKKIIRLTESDLTRIIKHIIKENDSTYEVKKGDTLYGISKKFGVSVDEILDVNPDIEDPDLIYPGDMINLPIGKEFLKNVKGDENIHDADPTKLQKEVILKLVKNLLDIGLLNQDKYDEILNGVDLNKTFDFDGVEKLNRKYKELTKVVGIEESYKRRR